MNKNFNLTTLKCLIDESINYPTPSKFSPQGRSGAAGMGTLLFGLVVSLRAKNILELGTASGGSAYPLVLGAYLTSGKVISVDNGTFPVSINWINNIPIENISEYQEFIQSDAIQYLKNRKETIDLVHIDDWHDSAHVLAELELVKDLLTPCGVITMHDAMYHNSEPKYREELDAVGEFGGGGVYKAIKDFVSKYPGGWEYVTIPADHGLTILRKIQK